MRDQRWTNNTNTNTKLSRNLEELYEPKMIERMTDTLFGHWTKDGKYCLLWMKDRQNIEERQTKDI